LNPESDEVKKSQSKNRKKISYQSKPQENSQPRPTKTPGLDDRISRNAKNTDSNHGHYAPLRALRKRSTLALSPDFQARKWLEDSHKPDSLTGLSSANIAIKGSWHQED
jgi:hypothetical protein